MARVTGRVEDSLVVDNDPYPVHVYTVCQHTYTHPKSADLYVPVHEYTVTGNVTCFTCMTRNERSGPW